MNNIDFSKILFLDIETVPQEKDWNGLDERTQKLWDKKTENQRKEDFSAEEFYHQRAGILAEFGKIICISCGIIHQDKIRLKSFTNKSEHLLLTEFVKLLEENFNQSTNLLCAHNGKEFDFPFLGRRLLINQIKIPKILQLQGKKPWEINHLDTLELWKFGDYKHYTSLDLLANVFGIETPKDDIDGSQVAKVYYEDQDIERIQKYCEKDVVTLINIFLKMNYSNPISVE